jgi:MFS family permease
MTRTFNRTFSSLLRHRNYRFFFAGQVVSQTGTWMQRIAQAWLVLQLTRSPVAVGLLALAQFLPFTILGLFAGVVVDRVDARRAVIVTQTAQMFLAVAMAAIAVAGVAQPWHVYVIAFLNGALLVFDAPSRQALTYRMVGRSELSNAVALNSSLFNAARIFGPAVAGVLIAAVGVGWCFAVNALSFVAVLAVLLSLRVSEFHPLVREGRPQIFRGAREGLSYAVHDRRKLIVLSLVVVLSTFCFNFNVLLPVLAKRTLDAGPMTFGVLSALFGLGALVGALIAAAQSRANLRTMVLGGFLFAGSEVVLAPARSVVVVGLLLVVTGVGVPIWAGHSNATRHPAAPDHLRGRVVGLYYYAFSGSGPLGGMLAGWLAARGGTQLALLVGGVAGVAATALAAAGLREAASAPPRRLEPAHEQARAA